MSFKKFAAYYLVVTALILAVGYPFGVPQSLVALRQAYLAAQVQRTDEVARLRAKVAELERAAAPAPVVK